VFTYIVEGHEFKDFDVWATAGGAQRACVETVTVEVTDGTLNINFTPQQQNPEINGIEILPAPPAIPIQTNSNGLIVPATHEDSSKTLNISSQNSQVVIETTNGRLTADKVQLQTNPNGSLNLSALKVHYVVAPTPPTPPTSPVPPAPVSPAMSTPPMTAGTLSEPRVQETKDPGSLFTKGEFWKNSSQSFPLAADGRLSVDNVNGQIEIHGWDRNTVAIKAVKHGKTSESVEAVKINIDSNPEEIIVHTEKSSSATTNHDLLPYLWNRPWFNNGNGNDATVDYTVWVPQNARLKKISSVNGQITIDGVSGNIEASTVNGRLQIQGAAGDLKLSSVNGPVKAQMASLGRGQSVSLDAVNGQLEAILPANANAEVTASTLNGGLGSEFPALVMKKEFPVGRHLQGTLGKGGARVKASTVNGSINFRQGKPAAPALPAVQPDSGADQTASQEIARLKLQDAEMAAIDAERRFSTGQMTEYELQKTKLARDIAAAEVKGDNVEVARLKLAGAESDVDVTGKKFAVGKATSHEYDQAKLARDEAAVYFRAAQKSGDKPAPTQSSSANAATAAAKMWLAAIDDGHFAGSWTSASDYFRGAITQDKWVSALEGARKPLGSLLSREVNSAQPMTELPGAPDGQYVIMEFNTSFDAKKSAIETVTFLQEKDGQWRAAGYYIK